MPRIMVTRIYVNWSALVKLRECNRPNTKGRARNGKVEKHRQVKRVKYKYCKI